METRGQYAHQSMPLQSLSGDVAAGLFGDGLAGLSWHTVKGRFSAGSLTDSLEPIGV